MEAAIGQFLESGLLGAAIVILGGVIVYLNKKLDKKDAENDALHREINQIHEQWRISDSERSDRAIEALNTSSAVNAALTEKIELGRGR